MKTKISKTTAILLISGVLLFASMLLTGVFMSSSNQLKKQLNGSLLKSESLLSEKLTLDKQLNNLKGDVSSLSRERNDLQSRLDETNKRLAQKENELRAMKRSENKISDLEMQIADLRRQKSDLEQKIDQLNSTIAGLDGENSKLQNMVSLLEKENKDLNGNLQILLAKSSDNYRIEAFKGKKEKLTVSARKTKKLKVGFNIPENIITDVTFKIITPEGKTFSSKDKFISATIIENDDEGLVASVTPMGGDFEVTKRIEMTYSPQGKLSPGVYKIEILNKLVTVGNCQIRLK
jgi:peptidoglycan hydrolase CwlO-like protein